MRGSATEAALFCRAPRSGGRYRVNLMPDAELTEVGISYRRGENASLLEWARIERALAAEVGEPEGVRTIVFDLVVRPGEQEDGSDGGVREVFRLDADPSDNAVDVARAIERALGERAAASLKSVAADGVASWSYPDLESFEQAVLEILALE